MKYVALLRGINVGGNSMIKMSELKAAFEKHGYTNVLTYINSGNVIFESDEKNIALITDHLEKNLSKTFKYHARVVVNSLDQLRSVASSVPKEWKGTHDLRCYVAFVTSVVTPQQVISEVEPKENIDSVQPGPGVVYLSTKLSGITKSGYTKLIGKKVYKEITMRNFNTVQKLLALMEK